ncbi:MAG: dCTP deaminase [Thermoplasmata archaeon]|jgi:dCTP deaminase|nr:dCTP deaminase [Thermoplasmatales archaeon]PMP74910.1 MAG: dCTP deaminase [Aciduliprofundum sp.]HEU12635.1 dCTP deaminase [Euryarchaeota archaeon]
MLSDLTILDFIKQGKIVIENFDENNLTPNGYDVRVEEIFVEGEGNKFDIKGKKFFIVSTLEYLRFPDDLLGQIWLRTTWARKGIITSAGLIDAGFEGKLNIMSYNSSDDLVRIERGERYAQIIFIPLDRKAYLPYKKRSGHYFGQSGIIR